MYHCHGWIKIARDTRKIAQINPDSDESVKIWHRQTEEYTKLIVDELKRVQLNNSLLQFTYIETQVGGYLHINLDKNRKSGVLKDFYRFVASLGEASYGILYEMDLASCEDNYPFVAYRLMGSSFEECPETFFNGNFNGMIDY